MLCNINHFSINCKKYTNFEELYSILYFMKNGILSKIAQDLVKSFNTKAPSLGLLGGRLGEILFLYYYSLIDKQYQEIADFNIDELMKHIKATGKYHYSYTHGFAGFGIGIYLLEESGFVEKDKDQFDDIDLYLQYCLDAEIKNEHYDFLHGVIGIGFYFLKHFKDKPDICREQIEKIVSYLNDTAIQDKQKHTVKWTCESNDRTIYNISLSHGMASIIVFLSRALQLNISKRNNIIRELLDKSANFIVSQQIDPVKYGSYFPAFSLENSFPPARSRLSWCYGDLGVALALWQAGKVLERTEISNLSLEVLKFSTKRTHLLSNTVFDAGLCHGASGIAQIFYRMYIETNSIEFKNAHSFWVSQIIKMGYHEDGIGGYKKFRREDWINASCLLEGSAGIGLALLSEINPTWDETMILSFR